MLSTGQVDRFRTFGFTVLRGHLADRVSALRAEVEAAIRDAYAATYDERVFDGPGHHPRIHHGHVTGRCDRLRPACLARE
jgi:hypothetical protein